MSIRVPSVTMFLQCHEYEGRYCYSPTFKTYLLGCKTAENITFSIYITIIVMLSEIYYQIDCCRDRGRVHWETNVFLFVRPPFWNKYNCTIQSVKLLRLFCIAHMSSTWNRPKKCGFLLMLHCYDDGYNYTSLHHTKTNNQAFYLWQSIDLNKDIKINTFHLLKALYSICIYYSESCTCN